MEKETSSGVTLRHKTIITLKVCCYSWSVPPFEIPFIPPTILQFASLHFGNVSLTNSQPHAVAHFIADLKDERSDMVES